MPSSSSSVDADSPPEMRRGHEPSLHQEGRQRTHSFDSQQEAERKEDSTEKRKMDTLNLSPHMHHYGIPLGTPAAREAAKSFWTMEQLRESMDKIVQYTAEQTASASPSLSSLGSSIESESLNFTSSGFSTPSYSRPTFSITPLPPHQTESAPTTPLCTSHTAGCIPSPLLHTTRRNLSIPSGSLPSSPRLSGHSHRDGESSSPIHLSPSAAKRLGGGGSRVYSAPMKRREVKPPLSVQGTQISLVSRNSSSPTFSVSPPPKDGPLRSASYGGAISPDDGFHE